MPFTLYFRPSFTRSLKGLDPPQAKIVGSILEALQAYYASGGSLEAARKISVGFFYKQLRRPYYETGIESDLRIVLVREQDKCIAILAGNHNQIRKFLADS